jgi:hypothetical protein
MTQKEIKEKLPPLSFVNAEGYATVESNSGNEVAYTRSASYSLLSDESVSAAIVSAINNTYGKNINPESVPGMLNTLIIVEKQLRLLNVHTIADDIQNIIKNATL